MKVTFYFIKIISQSYQFFVNLPVNRSLTMLNLGDILQLIIILTCFSYSCHQCTQNAQQTGGLLHKIRRDLNNDSQNVLVCMMVKKEFKLKAIVSDSRFFFANHSWANRNFSKWIFQHWLHSSRKHVRGCSDAPRYSYSIPTKRNQNCQ